MIFRRSWSPLSPLLPSNRRKMQPTALLSSSTSPFSSFNTLPKISRIETLFRSRCRRSIAHRSCTKLPLNSSSFCRYTPPPLHSTAVQEIVETSKDESDFIEIVETSKDESDFIEIGYICNVHGLQGEVRVKPSTDFPQMRFSKPGRRWLKERTLGKQSIREVELVEGRDHPGQKSWIIRFRGVDTVDIAKQLVGSSVLVREEEDRPVLEEGEFYSPDLVGMRVILKGTGEPVGTVVNIFNSGASDLLQVRLSSAEETHDIAGLSNSGTHVAGSLVWVPFVDAIVPDVDIEKRELHITPPKGLLELNIRSDMRSKKERRQLEWKQRKKAAQRLIAAKKKLSEMEQKHVFDGLRYGNKAQKSLIADQIVGINTKLFQQALQNVEKPSKRWNLSEFIGENSTLLENALKKSEDLPTPFGTKTQKQGHDIVSAGKIAIILVANDKIPMARVPDADLGDSGSHENSPNTLHLQALFRDDKSFTIVAEERASLPLIMVSPADEIQSFQKLFLDHSYFSFDTEKVWFIEEEKLPVVSNSLEEHKKHKILLKTPWEILSSPVGSGGIFSLLSSHGILENLAEIGVEYVQVCSLSHRPVVGDPTFLGLVASRGAEFGIKTLKNNKDQEEDINLIFSMRFLKKITARIKKLQFHAVPQKNPHVEMADNEWVDVAPSSPNSYELRCSIYSALNLCSPDKICMIEVSD